MKAGIMTERNRESLVIIGSGPAGWTAALYAARANLNPVVFEGEPMGTMLPGGQLMITTDVENYPGFPEGVTGPELMERMRAQALKFGVRVMSENVKEVDLSHRPFVVKPNYGEELEAQALIIATGANAKWLGLPNEDRLAKIGGGVSACAVCDAALPLFREQVLAVVGGGDTAMEEAIYLTKFASKVSVIHRRDELRASKIMQDRFLSKDNAEVLWNKVVVDVLGDEKIAGVTLEDTNTGERSTLDVNGLFIAIGHTPASGFLEGSGVDIDDGGYVVLKTRSSATNIPGVFAAGDIADAHYRQAVTAAGMGCQAALDAERWLGAQGLV
jgi:thioredoxin reductase (NADPH)